MSERLFIVVVTVVAVVSTISLIVTTPQVLAAHRTQQRFLSEPDGRYEPITVRMTRALFERTKGLRVLAPARNALEARQQRLTDRRVPDSLDRVVRHVRSGSTLSLALRRVGDGDPVFARLAHDLERGRSLHDAVSAWRSEDDLPNRRLTATALELASSAGGASARVLDSVSASLRDRVALEREVSALSSQSRASAVVLVVAPIAFAGLAAAFDDRILDVLIGRPIGWACIGLGLGLDGIGALWMARLISRHR
jgi:Flp pilus assembly protein TadB